ncbi:MAG: MBL fold metallo-hydrolase [Chloroflexi bacterium]|nr:MBL fold metallo-hydrolase [Chloroflexota bacterium]
MILKVLPVGPFSENTYVVGCETTKEAAVVDAGAEAGRILKLVDELGVKVKLLINTHGHVDHIGAVATVKERTKAIFAIHEKEIAVMKGSALYGSSVIPDFIEAPKPDTFLKGGDVLEIGTLRFTVIETPGHTPGAVCLYGHGVVFTGDTLFNMGVGRTDLPGGSWAHLMNSIKSKLLILPEETVILPGHGPHSTIGQEKRQNTFLRSTI